MTFDLAAYQVEQCLAMVRAGGGFDAYVIDKAAKLAKSDDMHAELPAQVDAAMGPQRAAEGRKVLAWFRRNP